MLDQGLGLLLESWLMRDVILTHDLPRDNQSHHSTLLPGTLPCKLDSFLFLYFISSVLNLQTRRVSILRSSSVVQQTNNWWLSEFCLGDGLTICGCEGWGGE